MSNYYAQQNNGFGGQQYNQQGNYQQQGYQQQGNYQQGYQPQGYVPPGSNQNGSLQEYIVDPDEKVVTYLSNSYAQNILTDMEIGSTKVFFTNKRFYVKANRFTFSRGLLTDNLVVDLKEISGTRITHINPIHYFIYAGIMFLYMLITGMVADSGGLGIMVGLIMGLFAAGLMTIVYFLKRGTYLHISYAGESIMIRVKMFSYDSVVTFLKRLQTYMASKKQQ